MALMTVIGRLTEDAEVKDGVTYFTVAENHANDKTSYYPVSGKLSEAQVGILKKGTQVAVGGDFSLIKNVKDEKSYTNPRLYLFKLDFVGGKKDNTTLEP